MKKLYLKHRWRWRVVLVLTVLPVVALAQADPARDTLKVCAPPYNLPMSNTDGQGYENQIAELFAKQLGIPVLYEWFPQRIGFIRNTLRNNDTEDGEYKCDLVVGVIENFELAATTRPYMRSAWAMVYIKGRGLDFIQSQEDLKGLDDDQKGKLRIGIWDRGPTTEWVFRHGLMEYASPYQSMAGDARETPGKMVERELVEDKINLTFVWGPIAGFYGKRIVDHDVVVIPMTNEPGLRFDYQISMAVRFGEAEWKEQVNRLIAANQTEIDRILRDFGVPLMALVVADAAAGDDDDD